MAGTHHVDLTFGVQAHRRRVERDACALGGAIGLRAEVLPHQLETTARVLADVEVRHLIADEVGLGKTVEALMVVNALRLQEPRLRVLIVVPNGLSAQWRDELLARAHEAPVEEAPGPDDPRRVRLAWPQVLDATEVDPDVYEMLIVDEFHSLTRSLQERILARSASFRHLLLISATPPFEDPERLAEIMQMLEPHRAACAVLDGEPAPAWALERDRRAAATLDHLDASAWEPLGGPPPEPSPRAAALAHCAYRRVIRTRREAYRDLMPVREHVPIAVEPLPGECERQRLMWRYFHFLGELSRDFDHALLAQRVIRGAPSLRQRVTYLRGHGHERGGLLEETAAWLGPEQGDSRFDALCDLLSELWLEEPAAKVLIAAGDNLTVDDLARRLPTALGAVGPLQREREVIPASIRNQTAGAQDLVDSDDLIEQAVRAFVVGEANLLVAADVAQLGLNLQVSRHIVLYSVPWDPQQVEQWIGRVDRIGNPATVPLDDGPPLPVRIYTIVQRGLVDERVLEVLRASSIFERSLSLDSSAVRSVRDHIREVALGDQRPDAWQAVVAEARQLGRRVELEDLGSPLLPHLPHGPRQAAALYRHLDSTPPVPPAWGVPESTKSGFLARDQALKYWVLAQHRVREFDIQRLPGDLRREHPGVRSIQQVVLDTRPPRVVTRPHLGPEVFSTHRRRAFFEVGRRALRQPPRREVIFHDQPVHVHFLDHGSHLHEALCDAWQNLSDQAGAAYRLLLPEEHPAHAALVGQVVLVLVARLEPERLLDARAALAHAAAGSLRATLASLAADAEAQTWLQADTRFIRAQLPAQLLCTAVAVGPGLPQVLADPVVESLLASPQSDQVLPASSDWQPPLSLLAQVEHAAAAATRASHLRAREAWSPRLPALREALAARRYVLAAEQRLRARVADHVLEQLERELTDARQATAADASATARGRVTRLSRQAQEADLAEERIRVLYQARDQWLAGVTDRLGEAVPEVVLQALVKVGTLAR